MTRPAGGRGEVGLVRLAVLNTAQHPGTEESALSRSDAAYRLEFPVPTRAVVLVSGSGTLLQALLDAERDGNFPVSVIAVGADRRGIEGLSRAERAGVPTFAVPLGEYSSRPAWEHALAQAVVTHRPDLVISAGFLKLLSTSFLGAVRAPVVNTHPALLPAFPGLHAVRDALAYGVKLTGCTLHLVDEGVDTGPVLAQRAVPVCPADTEETLHERIKIVERRLLVESVDALARHGATVSGREVSIP